MHRFALDVHGTPATTVRPDDEWKSFRRKQSHGRGKVKSQIEPDVNVDGMSMNAWCRHHLDIYNLDFG